MVDGVFGEQFDQRQMGLLSEGMAETFDTRRIAAIRAKWLAVVVGFESDRNAFMEPGGPVRSPGEGISNMHELVDGFVDRDGDAAGEFLLLHLLAGSVHALPRIGDLIRIGTVIFGILDVDVGIIERSACSGEIGAVPWVEADNPVESGAEITADVLGGFAEVLGLLSKGDEVFVLVEENAQQALIRPWPGNPHHAAPAIILATGFLKRMFDASNELAIPIREHDVPGRSVGRGIRKQLAGEIDALLSARVGGQIDCEG